MDFTGNSVNFNLEELGPEAYEYLKHSDALFGASIDRLNKTNPAAIRLYEDHNIHIVVESFEIAVYAQHNNGGAAL